MEFILLFMIATLTLSNLLSTRAHAHGYVEYPPARAEMYRGNESMVGNAAWEPQSLGRHQNNGWPHSPQSPRDGHLASADCVRGCPQIDRQTSTLWNRTTIPTGWNEFVWRYTAWHATASWQFFITKQGWDQNAPLSRASFDLNPIATEVYTGNQAARSQSRHRVFIPEDRSGYHVIYAVWTTTPGQNNETFYNVIDVNIVPGSGSGNQGGGQPPITEPPVTQPPLDMSRPTQLHTMGTVSAGHVDLMWGLVPGSIRYDIFRGYSESWLEPIGSSTTDRFIDRTAGAGQTYVYHVTAVNAQGQSSQPSNRITVRVPASVTQPPITQPPVTPPPVQPPVTPPGGATTWDAFARYNVGDIVMYNGRQYQARITFQGFGDPNWSPEMAPAIWQPL